MATEQSRALLEYELRLSDEHRSRLLVWAGNDYYSKLLGSPTTLEAASAILDDMSRSTLQNDSDTSPGQQDYECDEVVPAVLLKSGLTTLSITMDYILNQTLEAEQEIDWWRSVESSTWNVTYYLLQSEYPQHGTCLS